MIKTDLTTHRRQLVAIGFGRLHRAARRVWGCGLLAFFLAAAVWSQQRHRGWEVSLSEEEFKRLDAFETHEVGRADETFASMRYRQAALDYAAFIVNHPRSAAIPYALLRQGRALELDNKRFEAIRMYREVLDYFPNHVNYAAAALFYIGDCHRQSGDLTKAILTWQEMSQDEDYRRHRLAAGAINSLADNLVRLERADEAVRHYVQVATDFRRSNQDAAYHAIRQAAYHYVRRRPQEPRLRELFDAVGGFEHRHPREPTDDRYWSTVRSLIREHGRFDDDARDAHDAYYRYWAGAMEGKRLDDDAFQIDWADFRWFVERDLDAWIRRLEVQFNRRERGTGELLRWMAVFGPRSKEKATEYYNRLDLDQLLAQEIDRLVRILVDDVKDLPWARNTFDRLDIGQMPLRQVNDLAGFLRHRDEALFLSLCRRHPDANAGLMLMLEYYRHHRRVEPGLEVAAQLIGVPEYAGRANWCRAELLQHARRFEEAIAAYRAANNPTHNLWRIIDCLLALGRNEDAIRELSEIERFFPNDAPRAALRIAHVYRRIGVRDQYAAALRGVMQKYPASGESRTAHVELQEAGLERIGGGLDAQ